MQTAPFMSIGSRDYHLCKRCGARFLDHRLLPGGNEEKAHYDRHRNSMDDPGYRRFLARLAEPLIDRLAPGSHGLDFGCGPAPVLAAMLREAGHETVLYDPFYAPDRTVLTHPRDFITCSETAEHFHDPAGEFERLVSLLRPGGWLAVMTCFQNDDTRFADWHYRRDPTHVVFYRAETFLHIARTHGLACEIPRKDVVLMQRPD